MYQCLVHPDKLNFLDTIQCKVFKAKICLLPILNISLLCPKYSLQCLICFDIILITIAVSINNIVQSIMKLISSSPIKFENQMT
ncbi:hypothetical protein V1478_008497 [Vespula squamosa]|uniref:Uncharacterized protein n=1 Tax=Vespula squamosa TaxID=30214 RepID=A0ABD2ATP1_VESSQ